MNSVAIKWLTGFLYFNVDAAEDVEERGSSNKREYIVLIKRFSA